MEARTVEALVATAGKGFDDGKGSVIFSRGITQSISTAKTTELFYNVQVNKTSGVVSLNNNITVEHDLTLIKGIFTTNDNLFTWTNVGELSAPAPQSANYSDSYICICTTTGDQVSFTQPFDASFGFKINNAGDSSFFPVGLILYRQTECL
jgi:hypothetical protein